MSASGHSLPIRLVSASRDVRSSPKADMKLQRNICRDGPISDIARVARMTEEAAKIQTASPWPD
jgi:hypothetical protein